MIELVQPHEIEARDLAHTLPSVLNAGEDWETVARSITDGSAQFWRLRFNGAEGALVTQVQFGFLFVWHLGGKGLWRKHRTIIRELQAIVQRNGLKGIRGQAIPTLAKLYLRNGFEQTRIVVEWRA